MAEIPKTADRSSMEIKDLLRKLKTGTHKDRIRRLNKFRSYCSGRHPEFYDDDIPLLFLGADTPALYYDDDAPLFSYTGLLHSAGLLSDEQTTLKRSARHAMNLLAWLLLDQSESSVLAKPFLSLPVSFYQHMQLNLHLAGDDRGGAKEDACRIVVMILTQHCDDQMQPAPVLLEEVVTEPAAQQAFDVWSATRVSAEAASLIQQNAVTRQAELDRMQRTESLMNREMLVDLDEEEFVDGPAAVAGDESEHGNEVMDQQEAVKKQQAYRTAVRWIDSQVAREQAAADASAARQRQTQDEAEELAVREAEKAAALAKDPLTDEPVDMVQAESRIAEQAELALTEIQEDLQKQESAGVEEQAQKAALQKESLEQLIERLGGLEGMEQHQTKASILPTSAKFDPLLFLTLLHRKTPYKDLLSSMQNLLSKTENQAEQLQNLVRDNFPLFVKCAEGFETFRSTSEAEVGLGVNERIEKLEAIAESAAFQAKKSFKPLLDNTTEVRKVQSALSVLSRIAPILQVPAVMRSHMEHGRFGAAMKTYRRSLVVDETNLKLLQAVQQQAAQCVREARVQLEERLVRDDISELLNSIRDLNELLELDVSHDGDGGVVKLNGVSIRIRDHNPATSCLLLQAARFAEAVTGLVADADSACMSIFQSASSSGNHWKYDVLDNRTLQTVRSVAAARVWLPRLMDVAKAAFEDEKRRAAKIGRMRSKTVSLTPFEVVSANVAPAIVQLVQHAAFLSLGSNTRTGKIQFHRCLQSLTFKTGAKYVEMTFGDNATDTLRTLLRSPLPPSQCTKVGKELATLVHLLNECAEAVEDLRPSTITSTATALNTAKSLGDSALVTIEKRRCIYAFDVCSRACSNRASGSGKLDSESLLHCLRNLAEQLSRPEECANEVEKGCELVIRRCCEGLASYVRDRGDDSRLNAVAECADMLAERVDEVIREAAFLTDKTETVKDVITEDIIGLESAMFDEYLESIKIHVSNSVRVGWLENDTSEEEGTPSFPSYLSASLLAIVRCRAQVEQALGDRLRRADDIPYQHLSMATVADGVVEGICNEVLKRKLKLKVRQADRLANELEFLKNALKKFLGEESLVLLDSTLHMVSAKAGRGRDYQGDGPDGLAALEELERLGRVYVLCLGD